MIIRHNETETLLQAGGVAGEHHHAVLPTGHEPREEVERLPGLQQTEARRGQDFLGAFGGDLHPSLAPERPVHRQHPAEAPVSRCLQCQLGQEAVGQGVLRLTDAAQARGG